MDNNLVQAITSQRIINHQYIEALNALNKLFGTFVFLYYMPLIINIYWPDRWFEIPLYISCIIVQFIFFFIEII